MLEAIISAFWIGGTLISWVAIVGLFIWVIGWGVRFKFWQTLEGLAIWSFSTVLMLLVLNNIFGSLGASTREWWQPSPNDFTWWYFTRFVINALILLVISVMLGILRRHWQHGTSINITVEARPRDSRPKAGPNPTSK